MGASWASRERTRGSHVHAALVTNERWHVMRYRNTTCIRSGVSQAVLDRCEKNRCLCVADPDRAGTRLQALGPVITVN